MSVDQSILWVLYRGNRVFLSLAGFFFFPFTTIPECLEPQLYVSLLKKICSSFSDSKDRVSDSIDSLSIESRIVCIRMSIYKINSLY